MLPFEILYENDEIFLVKKPSGVAVQGGKGVALSFDSEFSAQIGKKIHLVHRLDKETEGILIVAKNQVAATKWIHLFSQRKLKKEYVALCFFRPILNGCAVQSGKIDFPIQKNGKNLFALTNFQVENIFRVQNFDLCTVRLFPQTGRTHQIRLHLAKCQSPIVQDSLHGNFRLNKEAKKILKIKTLCLAETKLFLPINGKIQVFKIEEPSWFNPKNFSESLVSEIPKKSSAVKID